jgi:hypothetical protein
LCADQRRKIVNDCFGEPGSFELPSAYGGCTLKPVAGVPSFEPIVCLEMADKRLLLSCPAGTPTSPLQP